MRRLLYGFAIGTAAGVGLQRLSAGEKGTAPSWQPAGDSADRTAMADDLRDRARDAAPLDYEGDAGAEAGVGEPAPKTR